MPLTDEERRELVARFMDMRLRGVHPDWIVVWCGANDLRSLLLWLKDIENHWPNAAHLEPPDFVSSHNYLNYYKNGEPVWEKLKKDVGCQ